MSTFLEPSPVRPPGPTPGPSALPEADHGVEFARVGRTFPAAGRRAGAAHEVLRDVSISVDAGEVIVILGASGCGKSTLLRIAAGLDRPTTGAVRIGGDPVHGIDERCAFAFQEPRLLPWRSLADNVAIGLPPGTPRAEGRERIAELLGLVGLNAFAAHRPRFYRALTPILDLMQTLPTFVYLIPVLVLFGLGMVPGLVATVIFALPASIRLTELGIRSTPQALLEAATAFGATPRQRIWKVELPYAFPQIMAGLNQTIMLSLSMVVVAGLVGAPGLGVSVVRALNQVNPALGFESGAVIVAVAIMLDRMLRGEARR